MCAVFPTQFLDYDRGCIMSHTEFMAGVENLRAWSAAPEHAKQYSSHGQLVSDKKQHRRVEWSAQKALQEPVTAAQTVRHTALTARSLAGLPASARRDDERLADQHDTP